VRKRTPFAPVMVSALKTRGIRVAGSDRLVLADQIAVQDLIALGDVLTLPEDDLALAAVLKSPLLGLDDDDLLALAPKRQGSLWQELVARAPANPRLRAVAETLRLWRARADQCALSSMPACWTAKAGAPECWRGSGPKPPMPSTSSSIWRLPTTKRRRRPCKAS
jgi:ATP-dependent exoDNAse (exonuclease V) beta subunit